MNSALGKGQLTVFRFDPAISLLLQMHQTILRRNLLELRTPAVVGTLIQIVTQSLHAQFGDP